MKKLKYERPEVEVELLDPELDIITISGGDGGADGDRMLEKELFNF